ncbi:MAG: cytochrome P450 [Myxococcota bacterium]
MDLDPIPQAIADDPHPVYAALRESAPVHYVAERDLYVLSRHADILAAIKQPEIFSSAKGVVPSGFVPEKRTLIVLDPPDHGAMRQAVMRAFTPRRMAAMEDQVRRFAVELLDDLFAADPDAGSNALNVDAFEGFTDPLPIFVMAELLGVDAAERPMFKRCGDAIVYSSNTSPEVLLKAQRELTDYLGGVFEERRKEPRDDLISLLLSNSDEGRALSNDELLGLCFLLLVAGTETTTSALGNALLLLQKHPEARKQLLDNPELLPSAVEEILRFDPPVQGLSRALTQPVEIHGTTLPKDARVHLLYAAANRDPSVFENADRFDISRKTNPHLSFGFGIHFCLGASLARLELQVGLSEWLRRAPNYRLLLEDLVRLPSDTNRGFGSLPVIREA